MKKPILPLILTATLCPVSLVAQDTAAEGAGTTPPPDTAAEPNAPEPEVVAPEPETVPTEAPEAGEAAQTTAPTETAPRSSGKPASVPPTQASPDAQFADKTEVEGLVGAQLGEEYYRWTVRGKYTFPTFREYMVDRYRGSKRAGIVLMSVMGTIGISLMAASSVMFIYAEECDYIYGYNSPEVCWQDEDWVAGGAAMIATGATLLATFIIVGTFKIVRSTRRMRILRNSTYRQPPVAFNGIGLFVGRPEAPNAAILSFTF